MSQRLVFSYSCCYVKYSGLHFSHLPLNLFSVFSSFMKPKRPHRNLLRKRLRCYGWRIRYKPIVKWNTTKYNNGKNPTTFDNNCIFPVSGVTVIKWQKSRVTEAESWNDEHTLPTYGLLLSLFFFFNYYFFANFDANEWFVRVGKLNVSTIFALTYEIRCIVGGHWKQQVTDCYKIFILNLSWTLITTATTLLFDYLFICFIFSFFFLLVWGT